MIKSLFVKPFASSVSYRINKDAKHAIARQENTFKSLIRKGENTLFGQDHRFENINSYADFVKQVPLRDYEAFRPYIKDIRSGVKNVLWPGIPKYFAKTSGTTSGVKYIPITEDSMPYHISLARDALLNYVNKAKLQKIFNGKLMFLSGSPVLESVSGIKTGRLSGIVNYEIPSWVKSNQIPDFDTNCIEPWEDKLHEIVKISAKEDMRLISGIPSWVQMYFEQLLDHTGAKTVKEVFPNFELFVYGGLNYEPYRNILSELIGDDIDSLELYPASEGFIAFQDNIDHDGLLLQTNAGIFYEFVALADVFDENPQRIQLKDVELDKDYAIILSSNAGLWSYNIGDTVRFVSLDPYRLVVSGRIKHFISAFGEHVIGKEVESAMIEIMSKYAAKVTEFTVAPLVTTAKDGLPCHEWLIEFAEIPHDLEAFRQDLDQSMTRQNIYYKDLIEGKVLQKLTITPLKKGAFRQYMKSQGKLGGQNKVPRLSNERRIAEALHAYKL